MTWHLVTTDHPPMDGGIASWAADTARALRDAGEAVQVYAPRRVGAPGVIGLWGRSWARWGHVHVAAQVLPRVREGDRVLAATWPLAAWLAGRCALSVTFHGSDLTRLEGSRPRALERVIAGGALLPVSGYLGGLLGAPHTVLPMPITPTRPARRGDDLLVIARLGPLKGVDRAIRLAAREGRGITVVGEGPERPALEALAAGLGVRARFTGRLARADIPWDGHAAVVLLSRAEPDGRGAEGLGLVLLEGAARGLPGVGSATGGIPEAAMRTLADPDADGLPALPDVDAAQAFVAERHGPERTVAALREACAGG